MQPGETKQIEIEKWIFGGRGLGRLEGRAVLVPYVLPGELVEVTLRTSRKDYFEAGLAGVVRPAGGRVEPRCPYFGRCGGCHYQHAEYQVQLENKRLILLDTLRRLGRIEPQIPVEVVAGPPWEYRNRTQFHIASGQIGLFSPSSRRLCPVDHCPISAPAINSALSALRGMLREARFPRFLRSLELFTNGTQVQLNVLETERPLARWFFDWCAELLPGADQGFLYYEVAGESFRVSGRSFFQVNRFLIDRLVETALEGATGKSAVDLYSGVGLFALSMARHFESVTAVESGRAAAQDLRDNAARAGLRLEIEQAPVAEFLARLGRAPDFVLADPPRSGLGKQVVAALAGLRPPRLTIVSCDPPTLARDLAELAASGYRIGRLVLVDLFPQTHHMETIVDLHI